MKLVLLILISLLAAIGLAHIVVELLYHFVKIKDDNATFMVIPKIDKNIDAEFAVRSVIAKAKRLQSTGIKSIVCIDNGLDEKTRRELTLLKKDYEYLSVLTPEEFKEKAGL